MNNAMPKNVAYTKLYTKYREEVKQLLFNPVCFQMKTRSKINDSLTLVMRRYYYDNRSQAYNCVLSGSKNTLLNALGRPFYTYYYFDGAVEGANRFPWHEASYCYAFRHSSGKNYLMFRRELYGYSVLDVHSLREYHYVPEGLLLESSPQGDSFIWNRVHYNVQSNMLAMDGCFCGGPSSVMLIDFSNPLTDAPGIDLLHCLGAAGQKYDGVTFSAWEGAKLTLTAQHAGSDMLERVEIPQSIYRTWF